MAIFAKTARFFVRVQYVGPLGYVCICGCSVSLLPCAAALSGSRLDQLVGRYLFALDGPRFEDRTLRRPREPSRNAPKPTISDHIFRHR